MSGGFDELMKQLDAAREYTHGSRLKRLQTEAAFDVFIRPKTPQELKAAQQAELIRQFEKQHRGVLEHDEHVIRAASALDGK